MTYEDLLLVPYKENGRDARGMDCYGLVLECCKRSGVNLKDVVYSTKELASEARRHVLDLGLIRVDRPRFGSLIQCEYGGELHIAFAVTKKVCIHMTYQGVRVTPISALVNPIFYEVQE